MPDYERQIQDPAHPVSQSLNAMVDLHLQSEREVTKTQRAIERITNKVARPSFLIAATLFIVLWIAANLMMQGSAARAFDPPPFSKLQGGIAIVALLLDIVILITQNRLGLRADHRAQMDLQLSLAAEQRLAKLIALMEELRRDMPNVPNRRDPVAEAMENPADPAKASSDLEEAFRAEPGRDNTTDPDRRNNQHLNRA